jgi:hypothetical protein
MLFAAPDQFRPEVVLGGISLAWFILLIDSNMVLRNGWYLNGLAELKSSGLTIRDGRVARAKAAVFLIIRLGLSGGLAQLTAVVVALLVFKSDIGAQLRSDFLQTNGPQIAAAQQFVDAGIKRAEDAVGVQSARVSALATQATALRQKEVDPAASDPRVQTIQADISRLQQQQTRADDAVQAASAFAIDESGGIKRDRRNSGTPGRGPRFAAAQQQLAAAKTHAEDLAKDLAAARARLDALRTSLATEVGQQSHDQLPEFEATLKAESSKLETLKAELASLVRDREQAIRRAVESSVGHVEQQTGFLARISALEHIADADHKIGYVVILIDVVSFGFELAAVLAKVTSSLPTKYSLLVAAEAYMNAYRVGDEIICERRELDEKHNPSPPAQDEEGSDKPDETSPPTKEPRSSEEPPSPTPVGDPPSEPQKRKRGRPRKYPPPAPKLNGQGSSEDQ